MELTNEFRVGLPVEQAWALLTDVERIAPCLPGAQLEEIEGTEYRGIVRVKVGPISAQYKGKASFVNQDTSAWTAVLKAEGRDTRGQGNATATVTATLEPDGASTRVRVVTDLAITGKVAQFGRGVLADVSGRLINQFVESLEREVLNGGAFPPEVLDAVAGPSAVGSPPPVEPASDNGSGDAEPQAPNIRRIQGPEAEPVDVLAMAGASVSKQARRLLIAVVAMTLFLRWRMRRRSARRT